MKILALLPLSLLLSGCSLFSSTPQPHLIQTMTPTTFEWIEFHREYPLHILLYNELKNKGGDCRDGDGMYYCYNVTGYQAIYTIPEWHLKIAESTMGGDIGVGTAYPYVLFPQRNSSLYLTGNTLFATNLREQNTRGEAMQTRIDFTTIEKLLYPYTPTIQYIPLKKGETIDAVLEMLHTEISLPKPEKEIWEEVACDLQDIERFGAPEKSFCYRRYIKQMSEQNDIEDGIMNLFIFNDDQPYYYILTTRLGDRNPMASLGKVDFFR